MFDRDMGEPDEYYCKVCNFALAPLSMMRGENMGKLLFTWYGDYGIEGLPHLNELEEWVKRASADSQSPR